MSPEDGALKSIEITLGYLDKTITEVGREMKANHLLQDERSREQADLTAKIDKGVTRLHGEFKTVDAKLEAHVSADKHQFRNI